MAYAPTITVYTDRKPCPRAEVAFTTLHASAATVTIWRRAGGRKYRVRGAVNATVVGSIARVDTEVPFGTQVEYWAEMFDASGVSLGLTDTATATVWCDDMWIHHPLDPQNAVRADFRSNATRKLVRPVEGEIYYPVGRRVGVAITGQRRGLSKVTLDVVVDTVEDADKLIGMFGDYDDRGDTIPILCIRKGASHLVRIPSPFFAAVLAPAEVDEFYFVLGQNEKLVYELEGDEVSPPAEGIIVPLLTRADIAAYYPTRAAVRADNGTRFDVSRRYDLAGTA